MPPGRPVPRPAPRRLAALALPLLLALAPAATPCPFCYSGPETPVHWRVRDARVALLVQPIGAKWTMAERLDGRRLGDQQLPLRVTRVLKDEGGRTPGQTLRVRALGLFAPETDYLLTSPLRDFERPELDPVTPAAAAFLEALARPAAPGAPRLTPFVPYLAAADAQVAAAVEAELAAAPYAEVKALAAGLDPAAVLVWIEDPATPAQRIDFLFVLLAATTDPDLPGRLEPWLTDPRWTEDRGLAGLLSAWLTRAGPPGLARAQALLDAAPPGRAAQFAPALVRALDFQAGQERRIPDADLRAALRRLLTRPEAARHAVEVLTRLEDWEALPLVTAAYHRDDPDRDRRFLLRRRVEAYLRACPDPAARAALEGLSGPATP